MDEREVIEMTKDFVERTLTVKDSQESSQSKVLLLWWSSCVKTRSDDIRNGKFNKKRKQAKSYTSIVCLLRYYSKIYVVKENFIECCCIDSKRAWSDDNDFSDSTDEGREDVGINSNIQVQSQQDWEISTSTKVKREGMSTIE